MYVGKSKTLLRSNFLPTYCLISPRYSLPLPKTFYRLDCTPRFVSPHCHHIRLKVHKRCDAEARVAAHHANRGGGVQSGEPEGPTFLGHKRLDVRLCLADLTLKDCLYLLRALGHHAQRPRRPPGHRLRDGGGGESASSVTAPRRQACRCL